MGRSREMQAIATALHAPPGDGDVLTVTRGGVDVSLSVETSSGTITGLSLQVARGGLPEVVLRREDDDDRSAKARGINVEAQTGDQHFDVRVYIETDIPEIAVQRLLAAPEVRVAVVRLLTHCERVRLDAHAISATTTDTSIFQRPEQAPVLVESMATLARALPSVHVQAWEMLPRTGLAAAIVAPLAMVAADVLAPLAVTTWPPSSVAFPLLAGGAGLLAWIPARRIVTAAIRGHSRADLYRRLVLLFLFLGLPPAAIALAVSWNGALGGARPSERRGTIVSATHVVEDDAPNWWRARVRWKNGAVEDDVHVTDVWPGIRPGDAVVQTYHRGALGCEWDVETDARSAPH